MRDPYHIRDIDSMSTEELVDAVIYELNTLKTFSVLTMKDADSRIAKIKEVRAEDLEYIHALYLRLQKIANTVSR